MSDNVLQTLQKLVQDVIAPDVRELKVRLESFEKQVATQFASVDRQFSSVEARFTALEKQMESSTNAILSAIAESKAQSELFTVTHILPLSERIAALEARRQ